MVMPPRRDGQTWTDRIHDRVVPYMNGRVVFYRSIEGTEDVLTGEGDRETIYVIWAGRARVAFTNNPRAIAANGYKNEAVRGVLVQIDPDDNPPAIGFGTQFRVLDGGEDPDLERLALVADSALNGSHRGIRTIQSRTMMNFIDWAWTLDEDGDVIYLDAPDEPPTP